jgi:serine/threonine-protein kinase
VNPRRFFAELKRRKVYRVAVGYAVVSWLVIQIATQVFPFLDIPAWIVRLVIAVLVLGFPLALILSWLFDLTPEGVTLTGDAPSALAGRGSESHRKFIPAKSVAVLPFENLSDDPRNAYFADGVHDDILTSLAKIADLKVISRTSVQQYKGGRRNAREIGAALGVAHILEGTVRRSGNRVRVNAQLINAETEAHVWGDTFDRELTDLFAIQSELAERITVALRAKISPREKANLRVRATSDLGAYELYLRARDLFQWSAVGDAQENGERALPLLEEALARDPEFALAYSLASRVHAELYWFGSDKRSSRLDLAKAAADAALRLQPDLGEAHLALGFYHYYAHRDYDRARAEFEAAQHATPNDSEAVGAMGVVDRRQGRWDAAIEHLQRARELDPRNVAAIWNLLETYTYVGRYADAERTIAEGLHVSPNAHFFALARAALALRIDGDLASLRAALREIPPSFDPGGAVTAIAVRVALMSGDADEAARRLAASSRERHNDNGLSGVAGALDGYTVPRAWYEGRIARARGDMNAAERAFRAARAQIEADLDRWPDDAKTVAMLGLAHAAIGDKSAATEFGRRAVELLPISRDALDGALVATALAVIYANTGEGRLAIEQLRTLVDVPGGPTRGLLRLEPEWSGLRDEPEFQKLVSR